METEFPPTEVNSKYYEKERSILGLFLILSFVLYVVFLWYIVEPSVLTRNIFAGVFLSTALCLVVSAVFSIKALSYPGAWMLIRVLSLGCFILSLALYCKSITTPLMPFEVVLCITSFTVAYITRVFDSMVLDLLVTGNAHFPDDFENTFLLITKPSIELMSAFFVVSGILAVLIFGLRAGLR